MSRAVVVTTGSLAFHAGLFALVGLVGAPSEVANLSAVGTVSFEIVEPEPEPVRQPEPEPEPEPATVVPEPPPEPVRREVPEPEPEPQRTADTPSETESPRTASGIESHEGGMATDVPEADGVARAPTAHEPAHEPSQQHAGEKTVVRTINVRALLRQWIQEAGRVLGRHAGRDYPRAARRAGVEGVVVLSLVVDATGRILRVAVRRSSGHEMLDAAALAMVHDVGELPAPPDELHWKPRPLTMPIAYRLASR